MKQCFVISPIGPESSDIRKDADDVFEYIIKSAMEKCNIKAFRSDHLDKPGRISEQMFQFIYNADLCIADLTNHNPNVFYELAVAQSANRPVILLIRKGQILPFDVSDLRCVEYDLEIRSFRDEIYIKRLINHIEEFEAMDWRVPDLFGAYRPIAANSIKELEFFKTSGDLKSIEWLKLLEDTDSKFDILGVSLKSWIQTDGFEDEIRKKSEAGCKIRILMMHEEFESLHELTQSLEATKRDIQHYHDRFLKLVSPANPNIQVRQIRKGIPHLNLTITDQCATMIQYMKSKEWGGGPLWKCLNNHTLYNILAKEFETLWKININIENN